MKPQNHSVSSMLLLFISMIY